MQWKPSERMGFFLKHGSLIVAVNSFAVAIMSLWLTIDSAKTDREYKEISMRPAVMWSVDPDNFAVSLKNRGVGPAFVKRVVIGTESECLDSDAMPFEEFWGKGSTYQRELATRFLAFVMGEELTWGQIEKRARFRTNLIAPGTVISADGEYKIFELINSDELRSELSKLHITEMRKVDQKFFAAAMAPAVYVDYCSLTLKSCYSTGAKAIKNGCDRKEPPLF